MPTLSPARVSVSAYSATMASFWMSSNVWCETPAYGSRKIELERIGR